MQFGYTVGGYNSLIDSLTRIFAREFKLYKFTISTKNLHQLLRFPFSCATEYKE